MSKLNEKLVITSDGELPIILSSPHGGNRLTFKSGQKTIKPALRPAKQPKDYSTSYNITPDSGTNYLTQQIANEIKHLTGLKPYQIKSQFNRKIVDANRELKEAIPYDSEIDTSWNKKIYQVYHQTLSDMIKDVKKQFPGKPIWLFDIHGHDTDHPQTRVKQSPPEITILIGTAGGETLNDISLKKLKKQLFDPLKKRLSVWLPKFDLGFPEVKQKLSGGYIVRHYSTVPHVNAIQLEYGPKLRVNKTYRKIAGLATGEAIMTFLDTLDDDKTEHAWTTGKKSSLEKLLKR